MPFIYVYSPSDFVTAPPAEQGSAAAGTPPFTLTLAPGATPTLVEITDNTDMVFDEIGTEETLTSDIDLDGTVFGAGTTIHTAYDLINTGSGHKVTAIHFGGNGGQQGVVQGIVSTVELQPGVTYSFNTDRSSYTQNNQFADYHACFVRGTLIETEDGPVPVEDLEVGQPILSSDGSFKTLRLVLNRRLSSMELERFPNMLPIKISAGALGSGLPRRDLLVSPQHRMLVSSAIVERMFDTDQVFISAKKLTEMPGIATHPCQNEVEYFHLVFDQHEVIFAEHAPTESFYLGEMGVAALSPEARLELHHLFPSLFDASFEVLTARHVPCGKRQKKLVERHLKNNRQLLDTAMYSEAALSHSLVE